MTDVRLLTASDIPGAMRLKDAAGWNQTEADWLRLLDLEPEGCFAIDVQGVLASTAVALRYGRELAWIGMVLTVPEFRGRGFATRLMQRCLDYVDLNGVRWTKLDATEMGRPVYRKLGFEDECAVERWLRPAGAPATSDLYGPAGWDADLDRRAFGVDRSALLARLAEFDSVTVADGFAMGRPGSNAAYFGPCVSRSPEAVGRMVDWFLARSGGGPVFWDLLPDNRDAVEAASARGFTRVRRLMRMARRGPGDAGPCPPNGPEVYAIAAFEYG
jgi:GNAT superfamily N-acetyltransferase